MNVYWLEQTEADLPTGNDWLSSDESRQLGHLRFAKRRADWRLGRWTAKRAMALCLGISDSLEALAKIQICVAPSGAPDAVVDSQLARQFAISAARKISISHSCGRAVCAVSLSGAALGCDLEQVAPRSEAFVADYFTVEEQALVTDSSPAGRASVSTLIWSAKESALKALQAGLRLDTRSLIVSINDSSGDWHPLQVRKGDDGQIFVGWWQEGNGFVRTLVSSVVMPFQPIQL